MNLNLHSIALLSHQCNLVKISGMIQKQSSEEWGPARSKAEENIVRNYPDGRYGLGLWEVTAGSTVLLLHQLSLQPHQAVVTNIHKAQSFACFVRIIHFVWEFYFSINTSTQTPNFLPKSSQLLVAGMFHRPSSNQETNGSLQPTLYWFVTGSGRKVITLSHLHLHIPWKTCSSWAL